jgi:hypothetical protein
MVGFHKVTAHLHVEYTKPDSDVVIYCHVLQYMSLLFAWHIRSGVYCNCKSTI